jgi:hypothetical protein
VAGERLQDVTLLRLWRFLTVVLAALALAMTSAHVLDLPQKGRSDPELHAIADTTLYRHFATVGAVYTLASIAAAVVLVFLVRGRRPAFGWTLVGAACLLLAFGTWLALVMPIDQEVAGAIRSAPGSVPATWARLRTRWEYGQVATFVLQVAGFCAVLSSVLADTSGSRSRRRVTRIVYWT